MFKKPTMNNGLVIKIATQIARLCWVMAITLLVVIAIAISVSRHFVPLVASNYKTDIENQLSLALQAPVKIAEVSGSVDGINPEITLNNIQIGNEARIQQLSVDVGVVESAMARSLRLADVSANGIKATLTQRDGGWQLGDIFFPSSSQQDLSWVAKLSGIHVNESEFNIILKNGNKFSINKIGLTLNQLGKRQHIVSDLTMPNKKTALIIADGQGAWSDINEMTWHIYAHLPEMDWLPWLREQTDDYVTVKQLDGSGQAWLQWRDGAINDVRVRLNLPSVAWQYVANKVNENIQAVNFEMIFKKQGDQTIVSVPVLSFNRDEKINQLGGWSVTHTKTDDNRFLFLLEAGEFKLDALVTMVLKSRLLPDQAQETLAGLNPRGEFHQLKGAVFLNDQHELINFNIAGQLKNVALDAWDGSPQVSGVDGNIVFNKVGGHFALHSTQFAMEFPDLFAQGWQYRLAKGDLYWLYDNEKFVIRSGLLNVNNEVANVFGQFDFTSPSDISQPDHLGLMLAFKEVNAEHRMQYIPTKATDKSLNDWLARAITKGMVTQGAYLYDGGVTQSIMGDETQQVALGLKNVDLKFDEEWPELKNISGNFIYNNDGMRMHSDTAQLLNADISNINVSLPADENRLQVAGQTKTSLQTVMDLLRTTPLHKEIGSSLDNWQTDGEVNANIALGIPLNNQAPQAEVNAFVRNSHLKIPDLNLAFTAINGDLNYSSVRGLSSQKLTATTFDMPVAISITTLAKDPSLTARVRTQGSIAIDTLVAWQPSALWPYVKGTLPYALELQIPLKNATASKKPLALVVNSSLQGTSILLPKPYGKTLKEVRELKSTTIFNADNYRIDASLTNEDVRGLLVIGKNKEPLKANIYLGKTTTVSDPTASGLMVSGSTSSVLVDEWMKFLETQKKSSANVDVNALGVTVDIQTGTLQAFDQSIKDARLRVDRQNQAWRVGVESPIISGDILLPDNVQLPYDVALKYIKLPKTETSMAVTTATSATSKSTTSATPMPRTDPLASINPAELPNMQVKIDDFRIGDEEYGKWNFSLNKIKDGVDIKNIQIDNMKYFSLKGEQVSWTKEKMQTQSQTKFKGSATTADLNTALKAWGNETGIISEKARFEVDMTWPGSPAMFSTVDGNGDIKFKFSKGNIVDVSGKANVLKVFGLMNLSALTNRLTGEFSDLFNSGISYDEMEGHVNLQNGIATFVKPMTISGPSSDFKISGTANFKTGEIDQEVIVTPPVGQNAAVIATVLCGPACGGGVWLFQKIAGSSIKKLTSLKYKMTGSFSNPEIDKETITQTVTPTPSPQP